MLNNVPVTKKLKELQQAFKQGDDVLIERLWDAPKAWVAAAAQSVTKKHLLILTGAAQEEARLFHDLSFFQKEELIEFPAWETLPSETIPPSPDIVGDRYTVLQQIATAKKPLIVLTSLQACLQRVIPKQKFQKLYKELTVGSEYGFDAFITELNEMGYQRAAVVSDKGEFAVRGGLVDLFPVSSPDPFRVEFFGDEITSLRTFDPVGQKSVQKLNKIQITPAEEKELVNREKELWTLLDYLGPNTLVVLDDLVALENRWSSLLHLLTQKPRSFASLEELLDQIAPLQTLYLTEEPIETLSQITLKDSLKQSYYSETIPLHALSFECFGRALSAKRWKSPFQTLPDHLLLTEEEESVDLLDKLSKLDQTATTLHFLSSTPQEEEYLKQKVEKLSLPKDTSFFQGYLSSGFALEEGPYLLFPQTEITQQYKIRRQKQRSTYHTPATEVYQLSPGDLIVHLQHGIGRFLGMEKRPNAQGMASEYFLIEYAKQSKLFVPLSQSHLISKYIGAKEERPLLHVIGGSRWKRAKEQTIQAIQGYAKELLELYATRSFKEGTTYPEDSDLMRHFEEEFPFVETEDQVSAIQAIKEDLRSSKPADRLVCGDVGYGKTEVAMRAAFKTVVDGEKQVAILVPTTILAQQHFETFQERMRPFPINVGILSRFQTAKQTRETLEKVAEGKIDILVGTHRIVSKDVLFKDLGLAIIDEEQRFGVRTKEHLKKMRTTVNNLTLSATPIPRTLYMSLIGARDISLINTPPQDRVPITTVIAEGTDDLIKQALQRELARDGQAFFIHNRVETIFDTARRLQKLLPQARIIVAHGQMHADEIDTAFHQFKEGNADILVATTLIENGIDIPNGNTILVDRADHFGLAELYQLRGRVGRWNRRAFAYFLVKKKHSLSEISRKRLNALAENVGYGGGMRIAMRDLEIRGAGDILGVEQSGNVSAIGFHLYCKLLKRTIKTFQGETPPNFCETTLTFPIDASFPEEYVNDISLRMELYQRLGEALSWKEVDELWNELKDRFGTPPERAQALYHITRIRVLASHNGLSHLKWERGMLTIEQKKKKGSHAQQFRFSLPPDTQRLETKLLQLLKREYRIS